MAADQMPAGVLLVPNDARRAVTAIRYIALPAAWASLSGSFFGRRGQKVAQLRQARVATPRSAGSLEQHARLHLISPSHNTRRKGPGGRGVARDSAWHLWHRVPSLAAMSADGSLKGVMLCDRPVDPAPAAAGPPFIPGNVCR